MKIIDKTESIIKESYTYLTKKFNVETLEEITDVNVKEYYDLLVNSLNDLDLNPIESINNLEEIIKDIDSQIEEENKKENPNLEEIEKLTSLRENINSQINRVR